MRQQTKSVRITERDMETLYTIAQLQAVRLDDVGRLLGGGAPLSERTVRGVVERWKRRGLVEAHRTLSGPSVITLTRAGAYLINADPSWPLGPPSWTLLRHALTTSAVAVTYMLDSNAGQWQRPAYARKRHTPDGICVRGSLRAAIEIELNSKSSDRWGLIFDDVLTNYSAVHYWVSPSVRPVLTRWTNDNVSAQHRGRISILALGSLERP